MGHWQGQSGEDAEDGEDDWIEPYMKWCHLKSLRSFTPAPELSLVEKAPELLYMTLYDYYDAWSTTNLPSHL